MQHPVYEGEVLGNAGLTPGIEEELQVPHDATGSGQQAVDQQARQWLGQILAQRQLGAGGQADEAEGHVHYGTAAHDDAVARQHGIERVYAQRQRGLLDGGRRLQPEGEARREDAAHDREAEPLPQVELLGRRAQALLLLVTGPGDDADAHQGDNHSQQGDLAAGGADQGAKLATQNGGASGCRPPG
ncbi:hypothetical protein D3C80_1320050 [compost metagenome]